MSAPIICPPPGAVAGQRAIAPPLLSDARAQLHDPEHCDITVRGVRFCFRAVFTPKGTTWSGGCAVVVELGHEIDERWLSRARAVAMAALERELGGVPRLEAEPLRCPDCRAIFAHQALAHPASDVVAIECSAPHVVRWRDGYAVAVDGTGARVLQSPP